MVVAVLVFSSAAMATMTWFKTFNDLYKPKPDTDLKNARCAICHVEKTGKGGLNAYGKMLDGKQPSTDALKAIENKDADKDGVSNIAEIKAGKLPGNPDSCPPKPKK